MHRVVAAAHRRANPRAREGGVPRARAPVVRRVHVGPPRQPRRHARFREQHTLKIWCRTADRSALTRRAWKGKAYGELLFDTIAFDGYVDPGPPTADIFEHALFAPRSAPGASPAPPIESPLPIIGSVSVTTDYDYRVTSARRDGATWHLTLEPKRDPDRNRLDDLWVDAETFELVRMRVRDHLYLGVSGQSLEDEFDAQFTIREGLPLLSSIHGQTKYGAFETEYTYEEIVFPDSLPEWYFQPKQYGMHRADAPD